MPFENKSHRVHGMSHARTSHSSRGRADFPLGDFERSWPFFCWTERPRNSPRSMIRSSSIRVYHARSSKFQSASHRQVVRRHRIRPRRVHDSSPSARCARAPNPRTIQHQTLRIRSPSSYPRRDSSLSRGIAQEETAWSRRREM
jgi:hypothetical protein